VCAAHATRACVALRITRTLGYAKLHATCGSGGGCGEPTDSGGCPVRPVGAQLKIAGRRLDAESAPLTTNIPDGYARVTNHATSLSFRSSGCWRIEATAGEHALCCSSSSPVRIRA
jgi:hypothetical protein